jgi:hypothetical protein
MTIDKNKSISNKPEKIPNQELTFETAPPVESSQLQNDECMPSRVLKKSLQVADLACRLW